jgi:hypothetical protein
MCYDEPYRHGLYGFDASLTYAITITTGGTTSSALIWAKMEPRAV